VAQPGLVEMAQERVEETHPRLAPHVQGAAAHPHPGLHEGADQPGPHRALVGREPTARSARGIARLVRGQGTQAARRPEQSLDRVHDRARHRGIEQAEGQTPHGEDLVGPEGRVHRARPVVGIHHVVQRACLRVPEPRAEGAQAVRQRRRPALGVRGGDGERVEPQGLHLDRLADARRDDVIADARVHPGECRARLSRRQQPVAVETDPRARARGVSVDDRLYRGPQHAPIAG
jgi:hypothetical protein